MKKANLIFLLAAALVFEFQTGVRADVLDNWTTNQITTNYTGLHHIVYGNGRYVAVGEQGDGAGIFSSEDGFKWTLRFADNNSWGLSLNYANGCFSGAGVGFGTACVSTNGTNWIQSFLPYWSSPSGYYGQATTYGNGLFVTVGATNGVGNILTSPDGVTWTSRRPSNSPGGRITGVCYGAGLFVAIGNNDGNEYTSSTGTGTWAKRSIPGGNKIAFANGLFLVSLNSNANLISVDGINWSSFSTGLTNKMGVVTYASGLFMAQCAVSQAGSYLVTSSDGTNWVQYPKPLPNVFVSAPFSNDVEFNYDVTVATDGTRLVAVGAVNPFTQSYMHGFVYTSDKLVGVQMTNQPNRKIILSGLVGRNYQIQSADILGAGGNWRTNVALQLTNTPYVWTDTTATNSARFYRGVLLP